MRLMKAQRDKQEEDNYRENESSHFTLRYSGGSEPELAREMMRALERHFSAIESELNYTPPDPIGVILYTDQAFADITRAPEMGRCAKRRPHARSGPGPEAIDTGTFAGPRTRIDAQLHPAENAWPCSHVDSGRLGAMDGREEKWRERVRAVAGL